MTIIKSTHVDSESIVVTPGRGFGTASHPAEGEVWLDVVRKDQRGRVNTNVPTSELAAALGLVTREHLEAEEAAVKKLRAELSECYKDMRIAGMHSETYRVKYEVAEAARAMLDRTARDLRAELDEAEATIARVRELTECGAHTLTRETIRAALDPKPAFVLPTEVPATIEASKNGVTYRLYLWSDGSGLRWKNRDGAWHQPAAVMEEYTGHRVIGGES